MRNLTGGNLRVVLPALARLARALAKQHLNHERRRERIETLNRIIESQFKFNMLIDPAYAEWMYALHLILWATCYEDLTHSSVKGALHFFADLCDMAYIDLAAPKEGE